MQHWLTYPNIDPIAIHLGPLKIHWYGISYLLAFLAVYLWMSRPAGRRRLGLTKDQIQDFLVYALVGVLVGGRTFFVFNDIVSKHDAAQYFGNPLNFIAVWNGGMAFHGGLVGVIVAAILFLRKHPGLTFSILGDEVVMLLPLGITMTRLVNFINDELWGDVCRPDRPWCMQFPSSPDSSAYRHPSQIYEAILDLLTLPILFLLYRRRPPDGVVAWTWFALYGVTRSVAELWRQPDFAIFGITGGQLYALPMILIGAMLAVAAWRRGIHTDERIPTAAETVSR